MRTASNTAAIALKMKPKTAQDGRREPHFPGQHADRLLAGSAATRDEVADELMNAGPNKMSLGLKRTLQRKNIPARVALKGRPSDI